MSCENFWGYTTGRLKGNNFFIIWNKYNICINVEHKEGKINCSLYGIFPEFFTNTSNLIHDPKLVRYHSLITAKSENDKFEDNIKETTIYEIKEPSYISIIKHKHTFFISEGFHIIL